MLNTIFITPIMDANSCIILNYIVPYWNLSTTLQIAKYPNQPMRYKIDTKNEWKTIRNHYYMVWRQKEKALKMNALLIKYDRCLWFVILPYFPMQNLSNIFPNTWSVVTSPTISERWKIHSLKSWEMKSPERLADKPSWTRWMDSRAWVRAS